MNDEEFGKLWEMNKKIDDRIVVKSINFEKILD